MTDEERSKAAQYAEGIRAIVIAAKHDDGKVVEAEFDLDDNALCLTIADAYAAGRESMRNEIDYLSRQLAKAANFMRQAHLEFTPTVTNSLALDFIERWYDPNRSSRD